MQFLTGMNLLAVYHPTLQCPTGLSLICNTNWAVLGPKCSYSILVCFPIVPQSDPLDLKVGEGIRNWSSCFLTQNGIALSGDLKQWNSTPSCKSYKEYLVSNLLVQQQLRIFLSLKSHTSCHVYASG